MKTGKLKLIALVILLIFVTSCASVPDKPICIDLSTASKSEGYCTNTISNVEFYVDDVELLFEGKTWSQTKIESLIVPASSWAEIKAYILKMCKKNNDCSQNIGDWGKRMDMIELKLKGAQ